MYIFLLIPFVLSLLLVVTMQSSFDMDVRLPEPIATPVPAPLLLPPEDAKAQGRIMPPVVVAPVVVPPVTFPVPSSIIPLTPGVAPIHSLGPVVEIAPPTVSEPVPEPVIEEASPVVVIMPLLVVEPTTTPVVKPVKPAVCSCTFYWCYRDRLNAQCQLYEN